MSGITFNKKPEAVGYWRLAYGSNFWTQFAMYGKPTDEQIKNTKELLGWDWIDETKEKQ